MRLLLTGPELFQLIGLAVTLDPSAYALDLVEAEQPLQTRRHRLPDIALVWLTGAETSTELQAFLEAHNGTRCIFVMSETALNEAMTSLIASHDALFVRQSEALVVVTATLVAMRANAASTLI